MTGLNKSSKKVDLDYIIKVNPNIVFIMKLYIIEYYIFQINRLIFSSNLQDMALTINAYYLNELVRAYS